jgi:acyl-coenzyme A synthetase/AMP-(fatty) acid ligase
VESALAAIKEVSEGCCHYDNKREQIICAYAGTVEEKALKDALKEKLPRYMLPDVYCRTAALPKTGNGKLDRVRIRREYEHEHSFT